MVWFVVKKNIEDKSFTMILNSNPPFLVVKLNHTPLDRANKRECMKLVSNDDYIVMYRQLIV